jgi:hypothetical protein
MLFLDQREASKTTEVKFKYHSLVHFILPGLRSLSIDRTVKAAQIHIQLSAELEKIGTVIWRHLRIFWIQIEKLVLLSNAGYI